jgi:hypothetical protein
MLAGEGKATGAIQHCEPHMMKTRLKNKNYCVSCHIREGIPTINGSVWGYYASRNGVRMLVVECHTDQRIQINGAMEIVVIETGNNRVQLGIDDVANADTPARS